MPKEKETQDHTIRTQHVFAHSDTIVSWRTGPFVEGSTPLRIVFDKENRNRDDYVGTSFHQLCHRFFGIRFGKDNEHHDRMTKNFDPPLESYEGKIRPGDGNETVEQKSDEPTVVANDFRKTDLALIKD